MTTFSDCAVLSLSALDNVCEPHTCRLLLPFDRPAKLTGGVRVHVMPPRVWLRCLRENMLGLRAFGQLRAGAAAAMDVLSFQLEPALALVTGRASRFLLADEVGLGKTIQAGLMLAELQQRGWCEHALILTPAGLRRQWADELQRRFHIRTAVVDAPALSALTTALPLDVNPWTVEPVAIASIDFVKQPEVLRALKTQLWDMLIVDEAHQASAASLRYDAVQHLGRRARHVVLLTATPHAGDDPAFAALCGLGRLGPHDPLMLFRRTRRQAGLDRRRRVHLLAITLTPDAVEMHRRLEAYVRRLWDIAQTGGRRDAQLAAMVLSKRAFSSAGALSASLARRIALLSDVSGSSQAALPFDVDADPSDDPVDAALPAFDDSTEERRVLAHVYDAAMAASVSEPKMAVLRRLLRRVKEPMIVFTEYRDTLAILQGALGDARAIVTLHGGQTPQERRDAVAAFTGGRADLLLATDAGAEGLNLHERCRVVVNLELPWNPMRLEQRIGRVDRIGQPRAVHAINLFARGTAEADVLARLTRRLGHIHASEIQVAASVIGGEPLPPPRAGALVERHTKTCDVVAAAQGEATRIDQARRVRHVFAEAPEEVVPATQITSARFTSSLLRSLDRQLIWFVLVRIANGAGRLVEDTIVPVAMSVPDESKGGDVRGIMRRALALHARRITELVSSIAQERVRTLDRECAEWTSRALTRERHLREAAAEDAPTLIQPGLFDSRAARAQATASQDRQHASETSLRRSNLLESSGTAVLAATPEVAFLLLVRHVDRA